MGSICAKFHQITTTLRVDAYYGALHVSHQDWVFKTQFQVFVFFYRKFLFSYGMDLVNV